jgi:Glycolipid transfer protein (GLTP)
LAPYHSFLVKPIFSAAMGATPYRRDFYGKMVNGEWGVGKLEAEKRVWLEALEERLRVLNGFMASNEAKW